MFIDLCYCAFSGWSPLLTACSATMVPSDQLQTLKERPLNKITFRFRFFFFLGGGAVNTTQPVTYVTCSHSMICCWWISDLYSAILKGQCPEIFVHFICLKDSYWAPYKQTKTVLQTFLFLR